MADDIEDDDELAATSIIPGHLFDEDALDEPSDIWAVPRQPRLHKMWLVSGAFGLVLTTWIVARATVDKPASTTEASKQTIARAVSIEPDLKPDMSPSSEPNVQARASEVKSRAAKKPQRRAKRRPRRASSAQSRKHAPSPAHTVSKQVVTEGAMVKPLQRPEIPSDGATLDDARKQVEAAAADLSASGPEIVTEPFPTATTASTSTAPNANTNDPRPPESADDSSPPTETGSDNQVLDEPTESNPPSTEPPTGQAPAHTDRAESTDAIPAAKSKKSDENAARVEFFNKLGQAQLNKGNTAGANMSFARALSLDPGNEIAIRGLQAAKQPLRSRDLATRAGALGRCYALTTICTAWLVVPFIES